MDTAWIALAGTILGGAGFKIIEHFLNKKQVTVDTATALREEMRADTKELKEELRLAEKELDDWKEKYFILLADKLKVEGDLREQNRNERA